MECRTARSLLPYLLSPGELGAEESAELEQHLAACPACGAVARAERSFDAHVGAAVRSVPVPVGLREHLVTRLAVERGKVWRKQAFRVTAAAAAILALAIGIGVWTNRKAEIDTAALAARLDVYYTSLSNVDSVVDDLRRQGVAIQLPPGFDPRLLADYQVVDFENQRVARLDYQRDGARAHVYVLSTRHFKVGPKTISPIPASTCRVEVLRGERDFIFVVVLVGDATLQHFQLPNEVVG